MNKNTINAIDMIRKAYIRPAMQTIRIQQSNLLAGSINDELQDEQVDEGW